MKEQHKFISGMFCCLQGTITALSVFFTVTTTHAVSIAQSHVSTGVVAGGDSLQEIKGSAPSNLSSYLNDSNELYAIKQSAWAAAATDLSRSDEATAGSLSGAGYASIINSWGRLESIAASSGIIHYFVQISLNMPLPFAVDTVPIIFAANGKISHSLSSTHGAASATGLSYVTTSLPGFDSYKNDFRAESVLNIRGGDSPLTVTKSFSASANLLAEYNEEYYVGLYGSAWIGTWGESEASFSYLTDPMFFFDQAAFDEIYGPNTFLLSDYFKFEFSPNMPLQTQNVIPEPSTILLFGIGLLVIFYFAYGKRNITL